MKPKLTYGVLALAIAFTSACKKKSNSTAASELSQHLADSLAHLTPAPVTYPNYSTLKVGNYWVYERFQIDQDGTVTDLYQNDSCYIDTDTLIRSHTYFKLHKRDYIFGPQVLFLRDSLHYIINSHGGILFSSQDFSTVFNTFYNVIDPQDPQTDTIYKMTQKMSDRDLMISVPAGTFKTSAMQQTYTYYPPFTSPGVANPRYMNMRYAENTGLVLETETFFSASPMKTEKRLIRYHLN